MILPKHLQYAIDTERNIIVVRKRQIQASENRVQLLQAGLDLADVWKRIPPVKSSIQFNEKRYDELKKGDRECKLKSSGQKTT